MFGSSSCQEKKSIGNRDTTKMATFNGKYRIVKKIGTGKSAKVYHVRDLDNTDKKYALKLIRPKYLKQDANNLTYVEREMSILCCLKHDSIVNIIDFGFQGELVKFKGTTIEKVKTDCVYILMEYVNGGDLFHLLKKK